MYDTFLEFIREHVPFKRLPLCMVSDSAPQIHLSVNKAFPYCRHIYCKYHLTNAEKLFGGKKKLKAGSSDEGVTTTDIKNWVRVMFTTQSERQMTGAIKNICDAIASKKFLGLTEKLWHLVAHGINGGRALQDVFTANTIASSRVEGMNVLIKKFGMDVSSTLFESLKSLESFVESQELSDYICGEKWNYTKDKEFLELLHETVSTGVTGEVLERMHTEYLLAHNEKYNVTAAAKESKAAYLVTYKENPSAHDTHSVEVEADGTMSCRCSVRMGYPCRHMFAVAEKHHLKIILGSINTRFYTNQEGIDMIQDNLKKLSLTVALVKSKQETFGDTYSTKRFRDVSTLIKEGVDVMNKLHNDLIKYKVPGSPGKECASAPEQAEQSESALSLPPEQEDSNADSEPKVLEDNSSSAEAGTTQDDDEQRDKCSDPDRIEWEALSTREQTSLLKQSFYEAIKVFNSETMKKYWKKFTKASTEGKAIKRRLNKKRFHCAWEPKPKRQTGKGLTGKIRAWKDII